MVVVIGHEKLTIEMQKLLSGYGVSVISAPKSSGVSRLVVCLSERLVDLYVPSRWWTWTIIIDHASELSKSRRTFMARLRYHRRWSTCLVELLRWKPVCIRILSPFRGMNWRFTEWERVSEISGGYRIPRLIMRVPPVPESAAPSSALPIGQQRILSATRLTRVNPASSPNIHRLQNVILGLVMVSEEDKRTDLPPRKVKAVKKEEVKEEVKAEGDATAPAADGEVNTEVDDEDDDEEEEPIWREEIGWREVCGFLTM